MRLASIAKAFPGLLLVLAIGFLGFIAGTYVVFADAFPARYVTDAYRGGQALISKIRDANDPFPGTLWQPARTPAQGVTIHDRARSFPGPTLYTVGHAQKAILVAPSGEIVHEWHLPYSEVWDESAAVARPQPDELIYYRKAHLYPNGDLLVIYEGVGDTPWGYGLAKMDKNSNLIWKYLQQTHHDFDIAPDGSIYALTHEIDTRVLEDWQHLEPPRVDDFLVVLSPDGKELRKISLLDAFLESPFGRMTNTVAWYAKGDFFHTNNVDLLPPGSAHWLAPEASDQQVMLSMRELNAIGTLDLETERFSWAMQGPWLGQHDPDLLPDGHILLFDNFGNYSAGGVSRIIEFDPKSLELAWTYAGSEEQPFWSNVRGDQQRLANGNTLITESEGGRIFEVSPDGAIVWEFVNPVRNDDGALVSIVCFGTRIDPASLEPDFRALIDQPGGIS
jgi:Arylsulfotransferase (ASST)